MVLNVETRIAHVQPHQPMPTSGSWNGARPGGNSYYRSSLTHWWYPAERRSVLLTDEEKETVLAKFIAYGHTHIGSTIKVVD